MFNVLNAYSNYDPEIKYAQGMNIVVSWILKFTRESTGEHEGDHFKLKYNEFDSFCILVYIMEKLEQRHLYDLQLSKLHEFFCLIESLLETSMQELYTHLLNEDSQELNAYFINARMSFFVGDLASV